MKNDTTRNNRKAAAGGGARKQNERLIEAYLAHRAAQNASPATIEIRRIQLKRFLLYLEQTGVKKFQAVDLRTAQAYRFKMIERDLSPYTVEHSMRAVQLLFRFLRKKRIIRKDPVAKLKIPKAPEVFGPLLSEKEIQRLIALPDLAKPTGIRDIALMEMLRCTGMKYGEAAALSVRDVDLERAAVLVKGGFNLLRLVPLDENAIKSLRLYLSEARPKFLPKFMETPDALWINRFHTGITSDGISKILQYYARQAGLVVTSHTFRRTCATRMLQAGTDPAVVVKRLGFSGLLRLSVNLQTTIPDLLHIHAQNKEK